VIELDAKVSDLFVGDKYFEKYFQKEEEEEGTSSDEKEEIEEEDETDTETQIDFSEGDKILDGTNADSVQDAVVVEPDSTTVSFHGLCRVMLNQGLPPVARKSDALSQDEVLPFKAAALEGLADLLKVVKTADYESGQAVELLREMYTLVGYRLLTVVDTEKLLITESDFMEGQPPLIVSRSIQSLGAAIWNGFGASDEPLQNVLLMAKVFQNAGGAKQGAWTVRESALLAASDLAVASQVESLRKHELLALLVDFSASALKDRKFWRVRVAGLTLLKSLVSRAGTGNSNLSSVSTSETKLKQQMVLEALLPFKEDILKLARSSLKDSQSEVTAVASELCGLVAWWP
jgi:hypothetical protein